MLVLLLLLWGWHLCHSWRESRGGHLPLLLLHDLLHGHRRIGLHGPDMLRGVSHGLAEPTHVAHTTRHHGHSLLLLLVLQPLHLHHSLLLDPPIFHQLPTLLRGEC